MAEFTPTFFLQLLIAVGSGGVVYGAIRMDLAYMRRDLDRLRKTVHDPDNPQNLVGKVQDHETRLAVLEKQANG